MARLSHNDRATVLQILKKNNRKFKGSVRLRKAVHMISKDFSEDASSSGSMNKDWNHWVVLHGNEKVVEEDVAG